MHRQWGVHPLATPQLSETAGSEGITTATVNGTGRFVACTPRHWDECAYVRVCMHSAYVFVHARTNANTHTHVNCRRVDGLGPPSLWQGVVGNGGGQED